MSKYLTTVVETYRVDSEAEVEIMLEAAKHDPHFILTKYSSQKKEKKKGGEIYDEFYRVTLWKAFNSEAEPLDDVRVSYEVIG